MLRFFRQKMKLIMITVAIVFAATMFYGIGSMSINKGNVPSADTTIAKVNGNNIDETRFKQIFSSLMSQFSGRQSPQTVQYLENMALNQTIEFTLLLQDAKKHTNVRNEEFDAAISSIMQSNKIPSQDMLKKLLEMRGFKYDDFKKSIKDEILVQKRIREIREEVQVAPDDLREIRVSHILIKTSGSSLTEEAKAKAKAEMILAKIKGSQEFAVLAAQYSDDPGSAKQGGDLGFFGVGVMVPEFEKAAFALKPGQVSEIIKTPFGYHILKLDETRLKRSPDMKKDVKEVIMNEKKDRAFKTWLYDLKKNAKIEIINPYFKAWDYRMKGKVDEAINEYKKAIPANSNDPYLYLFLGDCYKDAGQDILALSEYKKAVNLAPADPFIHISLGNYYSQKNDTKNLAAEEFRSAASVAGSDIELRKQLIEIFKKAGMDGDVQIQEREIKNIEKKAEFENKIKNQLLRKSTSEAK